MKKCLAFLLICALIAGLVPAALADAPTVVVSTQTLTVNGTEAAPAAYNIDGSNYFKLRDMAALLAGTEAAFAVEYDADSNLIRLFLHSEYEPLGDELRPASAPGFVTESTQSVRVEGGNPGLSAYNIDGYNYYKLRDLCKVLDISVTYDSGTRTAAIDTTAPYSADDEEAEARLRIEEALDLSNDPERSWTYNASADAWTLAPVCAVTSPELPDQQGVSVCVPGAYVTGLDTDGDGEADTFSGSGICGDLVIDYAATVTSTNGQVYTAATAPVILNTGAAGYGSSTNSTAGTTYAAEGYINVACGNRGKQDSITAEDGTVTYTGDAPCCLVDQKNAARYVRYNILLGNLPGSTEYLVSTGGSGGAAHAAMFAATSDNPDFYDYEIEAGAVGVYRNSDGTYTTSVTIDGVEQTISDGAWGCVAYSAITSLYEADMAMALEYILDPDYEFNTPFQKALAQCLAEEYVDYVNQKNWTGEESVLGFDLNGDGDTEDTVSITLSYDPETGFAGTYLTLWLAEFQSGLQATLDNLDYAEGWTWFDADGAPLSDEDTAAMTHTDRVEAFLEGRYAKGSSASDGPDGAGGPPDAMGGPPDLAGGAMGTPPDAMGTPPDLAGGAVGTPQAGTTAASGTAVNSANYATYEELLEAYRADIAEVEAGDRYGNNIVELYDPGRYIGAEGTNDPVWTRIVMGAAEGDMSMMTSLNLELEWLSAGTDAVIEWQWDGGHVPSEILGDSLVLYVDRMYGRYVEGAVAVQKPAAQTQTANGTAEAPTGTDISSWVTCVDGTVSFDLTAAAAYRTAGAAKATPGFDVIDYGQEDYVFGSAARDARHWDRFVLNALEKYADLLAPLF